MNNCKWKMIFQIVLALVVLAGLVGPGVLPARQAHAQAKAHPLLLELAAHSPDQKMAVIVQMAPGTERAKDIVAALGGEITKDLHIIKAFAAELSASAALQLATNPAVRWVSVDAAVESVDKPPPKTNPVSEPEPTPAPSSTASIYYLHNYPYPPQGDTSSQPVLPLEMTAPTTETLYNYDKDRDAFPGRLIQKGGDADGRELTKIQSWRLADMTSEVPISGPVRLTIYAAMKDFNTSKTGQIQAYLVDWNGDLAMTIATG